MKVKLGLGSMPGSSTMIFRIASVISVAAIVIYLLNYVKQLYMISRQCKLNAENAALKALNSNDYKMINDVLILHSHQLKDRTVKLLRERYEDLIIKSDYDR